MSNAIEPIPAFQKNRAALHQDARAICSETCHFLGLEMTRPAMDVVAELVYRKISLYGTDLEAFAKHAKRTVVNAEDVKLLVRRNSSLRSHLNRLATLTGKDKRRKTTVPKHTETPSKANFSMFNKGKEKARETPKSGEDEMVVDSTIDLTFD